MKNFFKKLFGANNSNAKIESVKSEESSIYTAENFRSAIIRKDIDFIIGYIQAGGDVNAPLTETRSEVVDGQYFSEWDEVVFPLDYVDHPRIEEYLRAHGAITHREFSERREQERLEKEKKLREKWEQEEKLKQAQKDEYIAKRLAEVEA